MSWVVEPGDYELNSEGNPVAVCTLADDIRLPWNHVAIKGHNMTENLGLERMVLNVISNPNIRFLIVCGSEIKGHNSGQSLISLWKNGVDAKNRIIDARGAIPVIQNIPSSFIRRFQEQVTVVDMIGVSDHRILSKKVRELGCGRVKPYKGRRIDFSRYLMKPDVVESIPTSGRSTVSISEDYGITLDPESGRISG
ncbi:MAG: tetrahydromethanopterin S-methyltransferase subunit A [Candidatus Altiarchaeota archaeon]